MTPRSGVLGERSQWSWPVNLPVQFFGIFPSGVVEESATMPWSEEIEHKCFSSPVGRPPSAPKFVAKFASQDGASPASVSGKLW